MTSIALPGRGPRLPLEQRSGALFSFDIEDVVRRYAAGGAGGAALLTARTGQIPVFARAGTLGGHDGLGRYRTAIHSMARIHGTYYGARYEPGLLLEAYAETNRCLQSEDFGTTWAAIGTPIRGAAAISLGALVLDRLEDDSAAALEGYSQNITFVGNSTKGVSLYIRKGTGGTTVVRLRDTTASADRLLAAVSWDGNAIPSTAMTTGTSLDLEYCGLDNFGVAVYRVHLKTTSVTAANTNQLQIYPATTSALAVANTGDVFVGGVMCSDESGCGSYIKTTTVAVTKVIDDLYFPINFPPQSLTIYVRGFGHGAGFGNATAGGQHLLVLGTTLGGFPGPHLSIFDTSNEDGRLLGYFDNGSATSQSNPSVGTVPNDLLELRLALAVSGGSGALTMGHALNEGTETVGSAGSLISMPTAWNLNRLYLEGGFAWQRVRVLPGVRTLADCRNAF